MITNFLLNGLYIGQHEFQNIDSITEKYKKRGYQIETGLETKLSSSLYSTFLLSHEIRKAASAPARDFLEFNKITRFSFTINYKT